MKILVTGGAGYIGTHTCRELLDRGHNITIIDNNHVGEGIGLVQFFGRKNVSIKIGDITNYDFVDSIMYGHDKVVHLAAIVGEPACDKDEILAKKVNVDGSLNILKACKKHNVKHLHFMSTASSYGVQDDSIIANENTPTRPISFYAKTKLDMEDSLLNSTDEDFYVTIFRPSTVHGISSRMRFDLIANTMTKNCFLNKKLDLFGLSLWRPIFWVGDAGRAIASVMEADRDIVKNKVYNCGNNTENYQIKQIGEIVASQFQNIEINYEKSFKDARSYKVDFSKFEKEVGFKVLRSLEDCVKDMKMCLENRIIADPNDPRYYNHRIDEY